MSYDVDVPVEGPLPEKSQSLWNRAMSYDIEDVDISHP